MARIAILEARFGSLAGAPFVGDSARDLLAARAAGSRPVLLRTGNGRRTEREVDLSGTVVYDDLAACVTGLLAGESGK